MRKKLLTAWVVSLCLIGALHSYADSAVAIVQQTQGVVFASAPTNGNIVVAAAQNSTTSTCSLADSNSLPVTQRVSANEASAQYSYVLAYAVSGSPTATYTPSACGAQFYYIWEISGASIFAIGTATASCTVACTTLTSSPNIGTAAGGFGVCMVQSQEVVTSGTIGGSSGTLFATSFTGNTGVYLLNAGIIASGACVANWSPSHIGSLSYMSISAGSASNDPGQGMVGFVFNELLPR